MKKWPLNRPLTAISLISAFMWCLAAAWSTAELHGWLASTPWWLGFLLAFGAFIAYVQLTRREDLREKLAREYAARADYEHWHLCHGDVRTGVYGAYRPAVMPRDQV